MIEQKSWNKAECLRELLTFPHNQKGERTSLDLDEFAEIVAPHGLSTEQLDELLTAVEEAGCAIVMSEQPRLKEELAQVLAAVRRFTHDHQRRPTIGELAGATQLAEPIVWRALRYGRVLGR